MMGLGSIIGTGVFVSLGLAAGLTGPAMILSLLLAGLLAVCNGLSTAQLAASHPVSGGAYEYAYRYIHPWWGFLAGWLFICAKSASAATAALGFGAYFAYLFDITILQPWELGLIATILITVVCLMGIHRTSAINFSIVSLTLFSLLAFVIILRNDVRAFHYEPFFDAYEDRENLFYGFLSATALMFVAYTGYGRVSTLGEEMLNPEKNIPRAIIITLAISFLLYMAVAFVAIGTVGSSSFFQMTISTNAPLEEVARSLNKTRLAKILSLGAVSAMLGVLLNLILGVSRVIYAMSKKKDFPSLLSTVSKTTFIPFNSVLLSGFIILLLILLRDIQVTWSFSAFTVLVYYAITNASALKLPSDKRLYPSLYAVLGLAGCLGLSFWVEKNALILGVTLLLWGASWRILWQIWLRNSPSK